MRYGEVSQSHRERFMPGAIRLANSVSLNLEHRRMESIAHWPGGGLSLEDDGKEVRLVAELPPTPAADRALELVNTGHNGLSVEFHSLSESRAGGIRVIDRAMLVGAGLVRNPSYEGSRAEIRAGLDSYWWAL